jgi:hypothetical protein
MKTVGRRGYNSGGLRRAIISTILLLILLLLPVVSNAETRITLKNSFIEQYKNKATIEATYTVDRAHKKPNAPSKDGDLHIAGRAPEIGLPAVAEIMNAADENDAVDHIHSVEGTGKTIKIAGAWRLWSEHGGGADQVQGTKLAPFDTSNPDHVFEIHPVTRVGDISVLDSLKPIEGFTPKEADNAFTRYENVKCQIIPKGKTTTIVTTMVGFNYVEFIMELNEDKQTESEDGRFVMASVLDTQEDLLVRNRRMVLVKDTEPEKAVRNLKKGDKLHVLGIPRIDLALVSWRAKNAKSRPDVLSWSLPYEIIIVGVYND